MLNGYNTNMEYMLNVFAISNLACQDIADLEMYNYLMSGEL